MSPKTCHRLTWMYVARSPCEEPTALQHFVFHGGDIKVLSANCWEVAKESEEGLGVLFATEPLVLFRFTSITPWPLTWKSFGKNDIFLCFLPVFHQPPLKRIFLQPFVIKLASLHLGLSRACYPGDTQALWWVNSCASVTWLFTQEAHFSTPAPVLLTHHTPSRSFQ